MFDLFGATPTVGSYRRDPMSIGEIDAHPDADRIWATIVQARREAESATDESEDALEDAKEDATDAEFRRCRARIARFAEDLAARVDAYRKKKDPVAAILDDVKKVEDWL